MMKMTREDFARAIKSGARLPEEVLQGLRIQRAKSQQLNRAAHAPILRKMIAGQNLPFGSRRRLNLGGDPQPENVDPTPLMCLQGFSPLGDQQPSYPIVYGTDEQPTFGALIDPQPIGALPNYPCHKSSVQTRAAEGRISIAVATGSGVPGYAPDQEFFGARGQSASASITTSYYLPNLDRDISVLQGTSRIVPDHFDVRGATQVINYSRNDETTGSSSVIGVVTTTVIQGIGAIFGDFDKAFYSSNFSVFLQMEQTGGELTQNYSPLDDIGYVDTSTLLKYDTAIEADIFFIETEIAIYCSLLNNDDTYNIAAADLRFAETDQDNQLMVYPDNAPYSCGIQVSDMRLCAF